MTKFKVWHNKEKRWLDACFLSNCGKWVYKFSDFKIGKEVTVCFSTGLNLQGAEPYEYDIMYAVGCGYGFVHKDYWGEWCLMFNDGYTTSISDLVMEKDLKFEIFGSKLENPELLEGF